MDAQPRAPRSSAPSLIEVLSASVGAIVLSHLDADSTRAIRATCSAGRSAMDSFTTTIRCTEGGAAPPFACLMRCPRVETLVAASCGLSDQDAQQLAATGLPELRQLDVGGNKTLGVEGIDRLLRTWPGTLRTLSLRCVLLGNLGAHVLAQQHFPQLQSLDLSSCCLPAEGAAALAQVQLPSLEGLDLRGNLVRDEGAAALAHAPWPRLRCLDLASNSLTAAGVAAVAGARWAAGLAALSLADNALAGDACAALCRAHLPVLERLDLSKNELRLEGARWLATADLPRLTGLDLGRAGLCGSALATLLQHARFVPSLQRLGLQCNAFGGAGVGALCVAALPGLRDLDLAGNGLDEGVVMSLSQASWGPSLERLWADGNLFVLSSHAAADMFRENGWASLQMLSVEGGWLNDEWRGTTPFWPRSYLFGADWFGRERAAQAAAAATAAAASAPAIAAETTGSRAPAPMCASQHA